MGTSIVILAFGVRLIFLPIQLRNYRNMALNKKFSADLANYQNRIQRLTRSNNTMLAIKETRNLKEFKEKNGLKSNAINLIFMLLQGTTLLTWAGLAQKFTYKLEDYPEMLNGGFLWFHDLTLSDPYFILPLLNSLFLCTNLVLNVFMPSNIAGIFMRKYYPVLPIMVFAVISTVQTSFALYIVSSTCFQASMMVFLHSNAGKKLLKIDVDTPNTLIAKAVSILNNYNSNIILEWHITFGEHTIK